MVDALSPASDAARHARLADGKALILYYSFTGNTETLARLLHQETGLPLVAIERPQAFMLDPDDDGPEPIDVDEADLGACDTIILGFPVWTDQLPSGLAAWLDDNPLENKTILPFCTHSGNGPGNTFDELKTACPGSVVRDGLALIGGVEEDGVLMPLEDQQLAEARMQFRAWLDREIPAADDAQSGTAVPPAGTATGSQGA
ncbi:MAG: flavodoxin [Lautropia sp.]|nr:flavodoxin [Lautropia sp.]